MSHLYKQLKHLLNKHVSRTSYERKQSKLITITCVWDDGDSQTYKYRYVGDEIDAIISCYKNVVWSKLESFEITSIEVSTA